MKNKALIVTHIMFSPNKKYCLECLTVEQVQVRYWVIGSTRDGVCR